jgi:hypothetical protein
LFQNHSSANDSLFSSGAVAVDPKKEPKFELYELSLSGLSVAFDNNMMKSGDEYDDDDEEEDDGEDDDDAEDIGDGKRPRSGRRSPKNKSRSNSRENIGSSSGSNEVSTNPNGSDSSAYFEFNSSNSNASSNISGSNGLISPAKKAADDSFGGINPLHASPMMRQNSPSASERAASAAAAAAAAMASEGSSFSESGGTSISTMDERKSERRKQRGVTFISKGSPSMVPSGIAGMSIESGSGTESESGGPASPASSASASASASASPQRKPRFLSRLSMLVRLATPDGPVGGAGGGWEGGGAGEGGKGGDDIAERRTKLSRSMVSKKKSIFGAFYKSYNEDAAAEQSQSGVDMIEELSRETMSWEEANRSKGSGAGTWRRKLQEEEEEKEKRKAAGNRSGAKIVAAKLKKVKKTQKNDKQVYSVVIVFPLPSKDPLLSYKKLHDFSKAYTWGNEASLDELER